MSEVLRLKRGSANAVASYTGPMGELVVDVDNKLLYMQDGVTEGGILVGRGVDNTDSLISTIAYQRTDVADEDYSAQSTDQNVAFISISAARTISLPAASDYARGMTLTIFDESGNCSYTNTISVVAGSGDTIDGVASAKILSSCGYISLTSNGTNKWTIVGIDITSVLANLNGAMPSAPCVLWSNKNVIQVSEVLSEV